MKIGFVLDDTLDTPDGVQQYVLGLGRWMAAEGHDVHYLVGQTSRSDIADIHSLSRNMKVRFNGNRMSMPLPVSKRRIKELLAREQFDVLHVQVPYSPWMAHRLILAAPPSTALFGTFHIAPHGGIVSLATRGLAVWTRASLRKFDRIFSVSSAAREFAHKTYGVQSDILPNIVNVSRFAAALPFDRYTGKPTILFLGRLVPRKGCQVLLEAVREVHRLKPDVEFNVVICGGGPLEQELNRFVHDNGLENIVEFTGFISEADKPRYLKSASLAVYPSSGGESFGIVILEAMAAAHPVVLAAANPGYSAVLRDYPDILFPVGDAVGLADKILMYLTDTKTRQKALDWQASYIPQFDTSVVGNKLLEYYGETIKNRTGSQDNSMRQ